MIFFLFFSPLFYITFFFLQMYLLLFIYVFMFCFVYVIIPDPTEDQLSHVGLAECGLSTVFYAFLLCFYTEINTTTTLKIRHLRWIIFKAYDG